MLQAGKADFFRDFGEGEFGFFQQLAGLADAGLPDFIRDAPAEVLVEKSGQGAG